jgi:2-polyprenyl-6-methoxyphenol hydroxylase-like FAD-dependent oxidoreductase
VGAQPEDSDDSLNQWGVGKPYVNGCSIGQVDHEAILREHLLREHSVQVELGSELVSFQHALGSDFVEATIQTHGNDATIEMAQFDWLIGADGAHSVVRKHLGCTFLGDSFPDMGMLLGDINLLNGWGDRVCATCFFSTFLDSLHFID